MAEIDLVVLRHALGVARAQGFSFVELATELSSFSATLEVTAGSLTPIQAEKAPSQPLPNLAIKAPVVGFFRDISPPLQIGQAIQIGDLVAEIVALGIANDVDSKVAGVVKQVMVEAGQPVEFGQVIALLEPN